MVTLNVLDQKGVVVLTKRISNFTVGKDGVILIEGDNGDIIGMVRPSILDRVVIE